MPKVGECIAMDQEIEQMTQVYAMIVNYLVHYS